MYEVGAAMRRGDGTTSRRFWSKWCHNGFSFWCKKYFWEGQLKQGAVDEGNENVTNTRGPLSGLSPSKRKLVGLLIPAAFFHFWYWSIMTYRNLFYVYETKYPMSITMVFGSIIAGMTSVGGGAIAFPVMTLVMKEPPEIARDLAMSLQANGMTAASFSIFFMKVSEKVSTPTSVVLMAMTSMVCWWWRTLVTGAMPQESWEYLLVVVPIVTIGAPFGALIGTHFHRLVLAACVYILNTMSLVSAFVIVPQTPVLVGGSIGLMVAMFIIYSVIYKLGDRMNMKYEKASIKAKEEAKMKADSANSLTQNDVPDHTRDNPAYIGSTEYISRM
ncbi:uncharacterized protein LOC121878132 isoform X2 [Homarus americanus]|uniref:uncharacterized protein LOC121878132 isoform X2 n=1 Tax=Homarus americanus TaxID=6706 RepID=UPI001C481C7C|nr:uncharacterized protein LOC121878132 isoform X2 [Homarus americanus]